jgi:hypothetical protein
VARVTRVPTPRWVRATAVALLVGVPSWLLYVHHDRTVNQARLSKIAAEIAGRPVHVHCPGVPWRWFTYDVHEGSVRWDASGHPSDTAEVRGHTCAQLDALAEGRRKDVLACLTAPAATACGDAAADLAMAVDTLTHEAYHLEGIGDEADTECHSLLRMARTAEELGATPAEARALAHVQRDVTYPQMPDRYRSASCPVTAL